MGLQGELAVLTLNLGEEGPVGREQLRDHVHGVGVGLVGHHAEPIPPFPQGGQGLRHSGVGAGVVHGVVGVVLKEAVHDRLPVVLPAVGHGPLAHVGHAPAHHPLHRLLGVGIDAVLQKGPVQRARYIFNGVAQRAVQIKGDQLHGISFPKQRF